MTQQSNTNFRIVDILVRIQTGHLQNGSINYYHCNSQLGCVELSCEISVLDGP